MIPKSGYRFSERSCSSKKLKRDDDSKKSHRALNYQPAAAMARLPNHDLRIASRTNAPTAFECGRPLTLTRFTSRQNSGSTTGSATTPGCFAALVGIAGELAVHAMNIALAVKLSHREGALVGQAMAAMNGDHHLLAKQPDR